MKWKETPLVKAQQTVDSSPRRLPFSYACATSVWLTQIRTTQGKHHCKAWLVFITDLINLTMTFSPNNHGCIDFRFPASGYNDVIANPSTNSHERKPLLTDSVGAALMLISSSLVLPIPRTHGLSNQIHIFIDFLDRSQKSLICNPRTTINPHKVLCQCYLQITLHRGVIRD